MNICVHKKFCDGASLALKYNFYTGNLKEKSTLDFFSKNPRQQVFVPLFL